MLNNGIVEAFLGKGDFNVQKTTAGNINSSFIVEKSNKKYVMQQINAEVFKKPSEMMKNVLKVTNHLSKDSIPTLSFIKPFTNTSDNEYLYHDLPDNGYWRCLNYIDGITKSDSKSLKDAFDTGIAFGSFISNCSQLRVVDFCYTIENFHNLPQRIAALNKSFATGNELDDDECRLYYKLNDLLKQVDLFLRNDLPDRITHNDTKIENLIFDYRNNIITVIDLDTVMPGKITDDFGDSARSVASSATENEVNQEKVFFDLKKFDIFTQGFSFGVNDILTDIEIEKLKKAPAYVTAELACRFLTDYFSGNKYFKIDYPKHNLVRAFNQTKLLSDIIEKQSELDYTVNKRFKR